MADDVIHVGRDAQGNLSQYMKECFLLRDEGFQNRDRFEAVDRAYQRENDRTEEQQKARLANRQGNAAKLQNLTVPMVMESTENSTSFLSQVYLTDYPMFKFGTDPTDQQIALMWNTLVGEDQVYYGWTGQFNIAFRNGEKYNFSPIEVDWCRNRRYIPKNGTGSRGVALEQTLYEGNKIEAHDPYNTVYDSRVPIHTCHTEGEFAGYIKQYTRIGLKRFLHNLGNDRLKNDKAAYESPAWEVSYYRPNINPDVYSRGNNQPGEAFNWITWATGKAQDHIEYKNMYTVMTLYARLMPGEYGIRAPNDQTPDIWKLINVNGVMVWAEPVPNAHDILPMIIVQPMVDNLGHQTKSSAENQQPFQEMVSALWNAKLQSARRRVTDRMLYNPLLIEPDHINSPNPSAKIPVRPTAYGRKLEEALYQIPFHDENSQYFVQEANAIAEWGMRANGQNRVSMGQFQKGNKLESEFQTVMANAGSRERTKAIMWENFGMMPIKEVLKSNYLQFAPDGKKYNRKEEKYVQVDMKKLRAAASEFQVGDGLMPIEKLMSGDKLREIFAAFQQIPGLAQKYDMGGAFTYLAQLGGADKLGYFEKTPEQIQYEQQLQAWQSVASIVAEKLATTLKDASPDQIAAYIGPMPQPPQTQQQQPPQRGQPQNANAAA